MKNSNTIPPSLRLLCCAALVLGACTQSAGRAPGAGSGAEATLGSTTAMLVTIAPEGVEMVEFAAFAGSGAEGEPVVRQQVRRDAGGAFRHTLADLLEAGPYTFTARALDADGDVLFQGSAQAEVRAGEVTSVLVVMTSEPLEVASNTAPSIHGIVLSNAEPAEGEVLTLDVDASDADGDPLVATWTATGGAFGGSASDDPLDETWSADEEGDYTLTVSIADGRGAATAFAMDISVVNGVGGAEVDVAFNTRPTVQIEATNFATGEADVSASQIALRAVASDPEGDPITFAWSTTCEGAFGDAGVELAETSFVPTSPGSCSFTVTAADEGGANAAVLIVDVACVPVRDAEQTGLNACALGAPCVPEGDPCEGLVCGTATDSCGAEVTCGDNGGACPDGGVCSADQTACEACVPDTSACGDLVCGEVVEPACGTTISCGECPDNGVCSADQTTCEACVPDTSACGDLVCGEVVEPACGTTISCGACAAGESCSEDQTACVQQSQVPNPSSCVYTSAVSRCGVCREYPEGADGVAAAASCLANPVGQGGLPGVFRPGKACKRTGLVGRCDNPDGSVDFVEGSRAKQCDLNYRKMNAARACEELAGGTWTCLL